MLDGDVMDTDKELGTKVRTALNALNAAVKEAIAAGINVRLYTDDNGYSISKERFPLTAQIEKVNIY